MPAEYNKEAGEFTGRIQVILCMLKLKFTSAIAPAACSRRFLGGRGGCLELAQQPENYQYYNAQRYAVIAKGLEIMLFNKVHKEAYGQEGN